MKPTKAQLDQANETIEYWSRRCVFLERELSERSDQLSRLIEETTAYRKLVDRITDLENHVCGR